MCCLVIRLPYYLSLRTSQHPFTSLIAAAPPFCGQALRIGYCLHTACHGNAIHSPNYYRLGTILKPPLHPSPLEPPLSSPLRPRPYAKRPLSRSVGFFNNSPRDLFTHETRSTSRDPPPPLPPPPPSSSVLPALVPLHTYLSLHLYSFIYTPLIYTPLIYTLSVDIPLC